MTRVAPLEQTKARTKSIYNTSSLSRSLLSVSTMSCPLFTFCPPACSSACQFARPSRAPCVQAPKRPTISLSVHQPEPISSRPGAQPTIHPTAPLFAHLCVRLSALSFFHRHACVPAWPQVISQLRSKISSNPLILPDLHQPNKSMSWA